LIAKVAHSRRYRLTALGRGVAVLFTKTYGRVFAPGLSVLDPCLPQTSRHEAKPAPLGAASGETLDDFIEVHMVAP